MKTVKTKEQFEKIIKEAQAGIDALSYEIVDTYEYIGDTGLVQVGFRKSFPESYQQRLAIGNVYATKELANKALARLKAKTKVYARIKELNKLEGREQGFIYGGNNYTFVLSHLVNSVLCTYWCRTVVAHEHERYGSAATIDTVRDELEPEIRLMLGGRNGEK